MVGNYFQIRKLWVFYRSLSTQQGMEIWWKHWGNKGDEEGNWPPYLTKPKAQDKYPLKQALPQRTDRIWDLRFFITKISILILKTLAYNFCISLYLAISWKATNNKLAKLSREAMEVGKNINTSFHNVHYFNWF